MSENDPQDQAAKVYNQLARVYQDKFMDLDLYNDTYDLFCDLLVKPKASVFEIACGPGNITRYLHTKRPDFRITASDAAPNMLNLACLNVPDVHFIQMDCREINRLPDKYNGIVCGFCMPYLNRTDCAKLIQDCSELLLSGGLFYFSTIEGDYEKSTIQTGSQSEYKLKVYFYEESFLEEELKKNGLKTLRVFRKEYHRTGSTETHLIYLSQKK